MLDSIICADFEQYGENSLFYNQVESDMLAWQLFKSLTEIMRPKTNANSEVPNFFFNKYQQGETQLFGKKWPST